MHPSVIAAIPEIRELCRSLGVRRLELFGSAAAADPAVEPRDVDVLVELGDVAGRFDVNFGLKTGLERLLGRPVDVVTVESLENPYFRAQVMRERESLYAA